MENNQLQSANGSPAAGKPAAGLGQEKLNRSSVGVADQLLITLNDHVLDAESAVKENTAQLRVMASSVELVRAIPKKMEAVEKQLAAVTEELERYVGSVAEWWKRVDGFERATVVKLVERMDALEFAMRQVAGKPAEWGAAMDGLRLQMQSHAELFEKPQVKTVHHRHYLNWYIWIIIGLFVACVGMGWLWQDAAKEGALKTGSDLLWRGAWQVPDSVLHDKLVQLKTQYDTSSERFQRQVLDDEAQDEELTQKLKEENIKRWQAGEAQQEAEQAQHEAEELKKQRKKR